MTNSITEGNLFGAMIRFSIPYLIASFLQTFYGLADLFITGQFNGAAVVTAVSVGSQVMHMLTVVIVGLAMGTTVSIGRAVGAKKYKDAAGFTGNSVTIFAIFAAAATILLLIFSRSILWLLSTPPEAEEQALAYLRICFAGIPFITAYNVVSGIFRGLGDTKRPMIFVAIAGVLNIGLDYLFIGPFGMGAAGAAAATVIAQAFSVILAIVALRRFMGDFQVHGSDLKPERRRMHAIISVGLPIACQEGLIQISFLIITRIANARGVDVAAAVGIVEKVISFLFLVPSAMSSTVSAIAAQNAGAGKPERSRTALSYGIRICLVFGAIVFVICQFAAPYIVGAFVRNEPEVVRLGAQYLRSYVLDCAIAGIHFCMSGYFSAFGKSFYSFAYNIISVILIRVPGAYLASVYFPDNLFPMGLAAPMGSLLSAVIAVALYRRMAKK